MESMRKIVTGEPSSSWKTTLLLTVGDAYKSTVPFVVTVTVSPDVLDGLPCVTSAETVGKASPSTVFR